MSAFPVVGLDLLFQVDASKLSIASDMLEANVIRTITELICIAQETNGNALELIYEHFSYNQEALEIADSLLSDA